MRRVCRMQEELKEIPVPMYLSSEEKIRSRFLYEQIFSEDTKKFVDYYYQYKTRDNQILVLNEDGMLVSMLHLNPYTMIVNGYEMPCNYIVAVATQKEYRHRGYMRLLLEKALRDMADQGMPFAFLMPASESIYAPFDFVWICPHMNLFPRIAAMSAEEQNRYLASKYQMFCKRDERYMENQKAEKEAEEGEIPLQEIPPYMARITDVCQMLRVVRSRKEQRLLLKITDEIIKKNNGYFLWQSGEEYSRVERLAEISEQPDLELTIGELASTIFEGFRICLSEMV